MLSLDPVKLLLIGVVALVVLGPDKLPSAARKVSTLLADLQKMRASLQAEVHQGLEAMPFADELRSARETVTGVTQSVDPRQALYRAVGLSSTTAVPDPGAEPLHEGVMIPGSIDLAPVVRSRTDATTADRARSVDTIAVDPGQN